MAIKNLCKINYFLLVLYVCNFCIAGHGKIDGALVYQSGNASLLLLTGTNTDPDTVTDTVTFSFCHAFLLELSQGGSQGGDDGEDVGVWEGDDGDYDDFA